MKISRRSFSVLVGTALTSALVSRAGPAFAAGTLEEVKARGSLRVGVTQAPPWFSKDPATGQWNSGVGVSAGEAMAAALGVKFEPVEVSWGTSIAALQSNKIDIMFVLDATEERKKAADFPESPLLYYSLAVLARDDLPVTKWEDLNKADIKISVPQATSMDKFLSENVSKADIQRFPLRRLPPFSPAVSMQSACSIRRSLLRARSWAPARSWFQLRSSPTRRAQRCARAIPNSSTSSTDS
jgi:polar amino acid transport system substrate-binding protein